MFPLINGIDERGRKKLKLFSNVKLDKVQTQTILGRVLSGDEWESIYPTRRVIGTVKLSEVLKNKQPDPNNVLYSNTEQSSSSSKMKIIKLEPNASTFSDVMKKIKQKRRKW